jgi:hypothetical protein
MTKITICNQSHNSYRKNRSPCYLTLDIVYAFMIMIMTYTLITLLFHGSFNQHNAVSVHTIRKKNISRAPVGFEPPFNSLKFHMLSYLTTGQCKINTIPILMHQLLISIIYISSVMHRPKKKLEIRNVTVKTSPPTPKQVR